MYRTSMSRTLAIVFSAIVLFACSSEDEPTRSVQFGEGLLDMAISDAWELESSTDAGRVYTHKDLDEVRLHFEGRTEDLGQPVNLVGVKGMVGKELNRAYGGVSTRVSMGGNAMIRYKREVMDEYDEPLHSEEWVLVKPVGFSDMARVEISLRMPAGSVGHPKIPELMDRLDKQVGDARIPRA